MLQKESENDEQEIRNGKKLMGIVKPKNKALIIKKGNTYTTIYFNENGSIRKLSCN